MINKHAAFTYLVGWSALDRWHYGVKWAQGCDPRSKSKIGSHVG